MAIRFCDSCNASLTDDARYCGNCGDATRDYIEAFEDEQALLRARVSTSSRVIALVFAGSLLSMLGVLFLLSEAPDSVSQLAVWGMDVGVCTLGVLMLGEGAARRSLGRVPDAEAIGLAFIVPVVSLGVAFGYQWLITLWREGCEAAEPESLVTALVFIALMPALVEEWMCRGVLWIALRPIVSGRLTILTTASLFAFLHGLNGGFVLELPHRFVMGLLLGWLRAKTGSVWPCVLAHCTHNAVAVVVAAG